MYNKKQVEVIKSDVKDVACFITEYLRQCLCDELIANTDEKTKLYTPEAWSENDQCLSISFGCKSNNTFLKFEIEIINNIGDE